MTPAVKRFLSTVAGFNDYNAIVLSPRKKTTSLYHPFWTNAEITSALRIREEWDVPEHLIPFYGDWHDLMCVDVSTSVPSVVLLDDDRRVLHRWKSLDVFSRALRKVPETPSDDDDLGLVEIVLKF